MSIVQKLARGKWGNSGKMRRYRALVAQLDRVLVSETKGREFESHRAHLLEINDFSHQNREVKLKKWGILLTILAVFLGLRLFAIRESFWFFGDLGRDLFVLQEWAGNLLRPPLLGPQTSVISFNQSAWYYYYLFPFFLVMRHSVFATLVATLFLYAAMIVGAGVAFVKKKHWRRAAMLFFLIAVHPQFVLQHRYVWNPSLVTPFLLTGFWAWWQYRRDERWQWLALFVLSLSAAVGLNFSIAITAGVMVLLFVSEQWQNKKTIWQLVAFGVLANLLVHAPTIAFELRHGFVLTQNLPTQELLQQEPRLDYKLSMLLSHLFLPEQSTGIAMVVGVLILVVLFFVLLRSHRLRSSWVLVRSVQIAGFSALLMLLTPIQVHEHYVFGILTFLLVALSRLPKRLALIVSVVLAALYLQPYYLRLYSRPASHTVMEQRACVQSVCDVITEQSLQPIFVNTQSASHNHQAREYVFWLREFGCAAIDTQEFLSTPTDYMAVVADRAQFENGKTGYFELSQFGSAEEFTKITCKENLSVHLLEKAQE